MVAIFRLKANQLSPSRIDPWHYQPMFEKQISKIKAVTGGEELNALIDQKRGIAGGATPLGADYAKSGRVRFYRTSEVDDLHLDDERAVFISDQDDENLSRSRLDSGDVVLTITGAKFGKSAVVSNKHLPGNISQHSVRFRPQRDVLDPHFLIAYLNGKTGQVAIWREAYGATRPAIDFSGIRSLIVPTITNSAQKYIGDKIRQAERLRTWAKDSSTKLANEISNIFAGHPQVSKTQRSFISSFNLLDRRLDAEFYAPEALWAENEIKSSKYPYTTLGELALRIKDGPGGWGVSTNDYRPTGVPVIRSVNIIDGECDLRDCVYISHAKHQELISHEAKKGSVLLTVRGTIGRTAVFNDTTYHVASLNAAVVTIDCKEIVNPYYLAAFLNSTIGKIQSNRIANGAVQLNMNLAETASNLVVVPPMNVQEEIAKIYCEKIVAKNSSQRLTTAAKLLVEALIEGQLSEAELIAAQQQLEVGDTSLDRAILSRLKTDGIAGTGQPLFADLDELYRLLAQAEGE